MLLCVLVSRCVPLIVVGIVVHLYVLGLHGLSCKKGGMKFHRHAALNEVLRRSFPSVGITTCLELSGLFWSDRRRHDGMTLIPCEREKSVVLAKFFGIFV